MPRRSQPNLASTIKGASQDVGESSTNEEEIDEDDLCPICQLLFYRPVQTQCSHTLCEACMSHWADVSITSQMTTVGLEDRAVVLLPHQIETRCPMCRTFTTSSLDSRREAALQGRYPHSYSAREAETRRGDDDEFAASIETLTVYIGNEHTMVRSEGDSNNRHHWKFFVRPSRTDLIEEVQIFLVSTEHQISEPTNRM